MSQADQSVDEDAPTDVFVRRPFRRAAPLPMSHGDGPDMLTVNEAAALLRVDRKTVHREIAAGRLPHIRLGRVIRIPRDMLVSPRKSA